MNEEGGGREGGKSAEKRKKHAFYLFLSCSTAVASATIEAP
jgi:hypothetical protein